MSNDIIKDENENVDSIVKVSRYKAREQAFILCFERMFNPCDLEETLENAMDCREDKMSDYAIELTNGVDFEKDDLDTEISKYLAKNWSTNRISKVSLCVLRIAIYEMMHEVPVSVAINEAVELVKKYATEQDASFVNGVLGSYAKTLPKDK